MLPAGKGGTKNKVVLSVLPGSEWTPRDVVCVWEMTSENGRAEGRQSALSFVRSFVRLRRSNRLPRDELEKRPSASASAPAPFPLPVPPDNDDEDSRLSQSVSRVGTALCLPLERDAPWLKRNPSFYSPWALLFSFFPHSPHIDGASPLN